jgi:heat shock protein HslJ
MDIQAFRGVREGPIGQRIVVVATVSLVAVVVVVLLAVAFAPPRPPGSVLTGTTWQWTGATTGSADVPLVVPDPADYTLEFMTDSTFRATADCITVSGTYVRVLAGRTGAPWTGLRIRPEPSSRASCGPDSLSDAFLEGLRSAARYVIVDSTLMISRPSGTTMTFEVGGPAAWAPGDARP